MCQSKLLKDWPFHRAFVWMALHPGWLAACGSQRPSENGWCILSTGALSLPARHSQCRRRSSDINDGWLPP